MLGWTNRAWSGSTTRRLTRVSSGRRWTRRWREPGSFASGWDSSRRIHYGFGRGGAELTRLDREIRLNLLAPILATGVESALVGQDDAPLVPLLRDAARRTSNASSPWAQQLPGLLPVEVAAIIHWACLDIERAHALIRDFEDYRDLAMQGEAPPDEGGISAELTHDDTTRVL